MSLKRLLVVLFLILFTKSYSQLPPGCSSAAAFCTGASSTGINFPNTTNVPSVGSYSCLFTQPNASWYYLQISRSGSVTFQISQTTGANGTGTAIDVDFIAWGPFSTAPTCGTSNLNSSTQAGCSYSTSATETFTIPNAIQGQYYMVLMTNFRNLPGFITLAQTGGTGATNCDVVCPLAIAGGGVSDCRDNILTANYINSAQIGTTFSWTYQTSPTAPTTALTATTGPNYVATPRSNNSTLNTLTTGAGQYCVTARSTGCSTTQTPVCTTISRGLPVPFSPPNNLTACTGSKFDLTQNTNVLLQGLPGNIGNYIVSYNTNATNALTDYLPISVRLQSSFTGTEGQIIYATIMDYSNTYCIAVAQFTLHFIVCAFATTNTGPVCAGGRFNLSATDPGVGPVTFSWAGPNGFTATGQNVTNVPTPTGTPPFNYVCTATPTAAGSAPLTSTTVVTVNAIPVATATPVSNSICTGDVTNIPLGSNVTGTIFNWTAVQTNAAGSSTGTGSNIAQTLTTTGNTVGTVDYTITLSANGCIGNPIHSIISVKPLPVVLATPTPATICSGSTSNIVLTSTPTGATFAWTAVQTDASGASVSNGSTIAQVLTAPGNLIGTVDYTITPTLNSCVGLPVHSIITINPTAQVNQPTSQVYCNGDSSTATTFTSNTTVGTTTYNWVNSATSIGLGASGTGNIPVFTTVNTGTIPLISTITVTPTFTNGGKSCTGTPLTYTITVNPKGQVNPQLSEVVCAGGSTTAVSFTTNNTIGTTTYSWANSDPSIGLAATGTGDIPSFTAINTGTAPAISTITVTPTYSNGGKSCAGSPITYTVTVNPKGQVNTQLPQVVCAGGSTTAVLFTTNNTLGTTTYNWANSNPSIGLAATGTGDIPSFTAVNTGTAPAISTITVTPTYSNGGKSCNGTPTTYTITVNPKGQVNTQLPQVICAGSSTTAVLFTTNNTIGTTTYSWANSDPSIGLAATGSGDILSFTAVNTGTTPLVSTITVTPSYTNGGVSCSGTPITFTITVNPTAQVNLPNSEVVCVGNSTTSVPFTTNNTLLATTYNWTNSDPSIGLVATGIGDIPSFTAVNTGTTPLVSTILVTPTFSNVASACSGLVKTFTITVNPKGQVNTQLPQVVCAGSSTTAVLFTTNNTIGTTTYTWANSDPSIGLVANGIGDIPSFTAVNTGIVPLVSTITVTPTYSNGGVSCSGTPITFTITVNPTAQVNVSNSQVVCDGNTTTAVPFTTNNTLGITTYSWANSDPSIGLAASGSGDILSFTGVNTGTTPVVSTISVTPTFSNVASACTGLVKTFTITVNPKGQVNSQLPQVVCDGNPTTAVLFTTNNNSGATTYNWINSNPSIGLAATGSGDIPSFNAVNTGTTPVVSTITVTPSFTNGLVSCSGTPITFTITVNPKGQVNSQLPQVVCTGNPTTAVLFTTNNNSGTTTYNWINSDPSIGLAATGSGDIPSFNAVNAGSVFVVSTITVTPTYSNGGVFCSGTPITFTITVNPIPIATATPSTVTICSSDLTNIALTSNAIGTTYVWTSAATNVTGASSASGNTITDALTATAVNPGTVVYTITPSGSGCTGLPITATVIVNPLPTATISGATTICNGSSTTVSFSGTPGAKVTYTVNGGANQIVLLDSLGIGSVSTGNLTATTTYQLVSVLAAGLPACTQGQLGSVVVTVIPVPLVNSVVSSPTLCSGQSTGISLTSNVTTANFNWTITQTGISGASVGSGNTISQNLIATGIVPGIVTYNITASEGSCLGPVTPITITVNPTPVVTPLTVLQSVCSGSVTPIVLNSNVNGTVFNWNVIQTNVTGASNGTGGSISQVLTTTSNNVGEAVYSVTPTVGGCPGASILVTVKVNPIPVVTANSAFATICSSSRTNIALTSTVAGSTFSWTVIQSGIFGASSGIGNLIDQTLTTVSNSPGSVRYIITPTYNGCSGAPISVNTTINPTPEVFGSSSSTICSGEKPNITLSPSIAATTFAWTVNAINVTGAQAGTGLTINDVLTASPNLGTAIYSVTPTANGCSGSILNITVTVNPLPDPQINDGVICVNQATGISYKNYILDTHLSNAAYDFVWYFKGVLINGAVNNTYEATQAGEYSVIATNSATGCKSVLMKAFVVASYPGLTISTDQTFAFSDNATITVNVTGGNAILLYSLDNGPNQTSNIFSDVYAGPHIVTVTDANGCTNLTQLVSIIGYPTFFTPNGDGFHDTWNIVGLGASAKVFIFDRYGKLVKQIVPSGEGWDGTLNGEPLIATDYWFTVDYSEPKTGESKVFHSHFSLKR